MVKTSLYTVAASSCSGTNPRPPVQQWGKATVKCRRSPHWSYASLQASCFLACQRCS